MNFSFERCLLLQVLYRRVAAILIGSRIPEMRALRNLSSIPMVIISLLVLTHSMTNRGKKTLLKTITEDKYEGIVNSGFCRHFSALHKYNYYANIDVLGKSI